MTISYVIVPWIGVMAAGYALGAIVMREPDERRRHYGQIGNWFLLMTLGPSVLLLALVDPARGRVAQLIATFGRVPLAYYLLHIPLIHAIALIVYFLRDGAIHPEWFVNAPYAPVPEEQRWGLGLLNVVWAVVVFLLYWPCRWLASVKAGGQHRWLRFV